MGLNLRAVSNMRKQSKSWKQQRQHLCRQSRSKTKFRKSWRKRLHKIGSDRPRDQTSNNYGRRNTDFFFCSKPGQKKNCIGRTLNTYQEKSDSPFDKITQIYKLETADVEAGLGWMPTALAVLQWGYYLTSWQPSCRSPLPRRYRVTSRSNCSTRTQRGLS